MAIVNSLAVGKAVNSAGNLTYRTVRGRTIASQKREVGNVESLRDTFQTRLLRAASVFMKNHVDDINVSFAKSKFGSQRNNFMKINKAGLRGALFGISMSATDADIENAVTAYATANPMSIKRVSLPGFETVYLTGAWSSDDNPVSGGGNQDLSNGQVESVLTNGATVAAPAASSTKFKAGAKIVRSGGTATITLLSLPAGITAGDITYVTTLGAAIDPAITVSSVVSTSGKLIYTTPALADSANIQGVKVGEQYVRLTSAYVTTEAPDPGA